VKPHSDKDLNSDPASDDRSGDHLEDPTGETPWSADGSDVDTTIVKPAPFQPRLKKSLAVLIVLNGPEIGTQYPLRGACCKIGRTSSAEIAIQSDSLISRYHAQIEQCFDEETRELSHVLSDLESTNHTFVNGEAVDRVVLRDGDQIQTGETTIRFAILDEMEARFHKEIHERLRFDTLTGLLTKASFDLAAGAELDRCVKRKRPLSVLMMDIDFFRKVNDSHGHQGGSWILSELGQFLDDNLRGFDLVGRFGGEEFVAALPEASTEQASDVAERIRSRLEEHVFVWNEEDVKITISIGVAHYPAHASDLKALISAADAALYECKHTGRNKTCVATIVSEEGDISGSRSDDDANDAAA